jgi:hypothetical protein
MFLMLAMVSAQRILSPVVDFIPLFLLIELEQAIPGSELLPFSIPFIETV